MTRDPFFDVRISTLGFMRPPGPTVQAGAESTKTVAAARERDFVVGLESIRGLAALSVALFHSFHLLPVDGIRAYDRTLWNFPSTDSLLMRLITIPFNGGAAVSLFFVLSGFVLTLSLQRDDRILPLKGWAFVLRRLFRIYPTLAINVVLFALVIMTIATYFPIIPVSPLSQRDVVTNLILKDFPVNGATWSLMIELVAIPFLFFGYCIVRHWGVSGLTVLIILSIITLFSPKLAYRTLIGDFVFMFFLGMLVAEIWVQKLVSLNKETARSWIIAAVAVMLSARFFLGYGSKWSLLFEGFASAAFIAAIVLGPRFAIHDVLEMKPFRFLGRISYSFYLYHPLALAVFVPTLTILVPPYWLSAHPFLGSATIAITTFGATILLAYVSFVFTEKPMIRFSRRF
jgi:peptidoglycan/LPS O-acetylase OafA/YrhL